MNLLPFTRKFRLMPLALLFCAGLIITSETSCVQKPGCGNRRDHRVRRKKVKKFAPGMSYGYVMPVKKKYTSFN